MFDTYFCKRKFKWKDSNNTDDRNKLAKLLTKRQPKQISTPKKELSYGNEEDNEEETRIFISKENGKKGRLFHLSADSTLAEARNNIIAAQLLKTSFNFLNEYIIIYVCVTFSLVTLK